MAEHSSLVLLNLSSVVNLQAELAYFQAHLATLEGQTPPPPPPPQPAVPPLGLSINDLTTASSFLGSYDLSSLLEPMVPPSWTMQPPRSQMDPRQFMSFGATRAPTDLPPAQDGTGDFQELARELLQRSTNEGSGPGACKTEGSSLPP
ncbi:hypothetical protein L1987_73147 [Smallanthus sonchifolius]|uniref:Uncharacterized protein n=1 Tax=Smallanthus sonchifolius TaxID=185202 RepID=A0ACB9A4B1_9ASTR|nr:hypothetical protein L1987_73147 [Smallanthus sonchifolius]